MGKAITCQLTPLLERYFLFPQTVEYKEREIYVPLQKFQGSFILNLTIFHHTPMSYMERKQCLLKM